MCFWHDSLQWVRASSFTRFLHHTRFPGRVISSSQRPLSDNTHNNQNRQSPCRRWNSNLQSHQTYALDLRGHWGRLNRGISSLIPNLIDRWKCVAKAKLRPFYTPGKSPDTLSTGERVCLGACPDGHGM